MSLRTGQPSTDILPSRNTDAGFLRFNGPWQTDHPGSGAWVAGSGTDLAVRLPPGCAGGVSPVSPDRPSRSLGPLLHNSPGAAVMQMAVGSFGCPDDQDCTGGLEARLALRRNVLGVPQQECPDIPECGVVARVIVGAARQDVEADTPKKLAQSFLVLLNLCRMILGTPSPGRWHAIRSFKHRIIRAHTIARRCHPLATFVRSERSINRTSLPAAGIRLPNCEGVHAFHEMPTPPASLACLNPSRPTRTTRNRFVYRGLNA